MLFSEITMSLLRVYGEVLHQVRLITGVVNPISTFSLQWLGTAITSFLGRPLAAKKEHYFGVKGSILYVYFTGVS
jgi:hypothetical protein